MGKVKTIEQYIPEISVIYPQKNKHGEKRCSKCGVLKTLSEFYKHKRGKDGLAWSCKSCNKEYKEKNKEKISLRTKKYNQEHKNERRDSAYKYYLKNVDKIKEYSEKNKEKINLRTKKYNQEHKNERRDSDHKYYLENIDKIKEYNAERRPRNREHDKKYFREYLIINREKRYENVRRYNKTTNGRNTRNRLRQLRRTFGYTPINKQFCGSEFHHFHINNSSDLGIFIPREIHHSVYHSSLDGTGLKEINKIALLWLCEQAVI